MPGDLDKLQGTWSITSVEVDGQQMALPDFGGASVVIANDRFKSTGMGMDYEGVVTLQEKQKPKAFDLAFTAGPQRGTRHSGIYELDGDTWTLCFATRGGRRPKTFVTKPDSGLVLETLARGVPAAGSTPRKTASARTVDTSSQTAVSAPLPTSTAAPTLEGEWAMVAGVFNGVALKDDMVSWCRRITRGDVTRVIAGPQILVEARFTVDTSQLPHLIEYANLAGTLKGKKQAGIFERRGDLLEVCMAAPGKARPTEFSSTPGDDRSYTTWRLEKP